jgi:predicted NACHT family NTPase
MEIPARRMSSFPDLMPPLKYRFLKLLNRPKNAGRKGLVILGDPGSGKTTHMKRMLLWCLRKGPETMGPSQDMLPVFLPLRELKQLE